MSGGSRIVGLWGRARDDGAAGALIEELPGPLDLTEDFDEPVESNWGRIGAGVAIAASLGWIGAMSWLSWPQLGADKPLEIATFAALISTPIALIGVIWLLAMRTSRAEARRFGTTARAMRTEAARLERMISAMTRRLEDNRAALSEQTNQMLALGENAAIRIAAVGAGVGEHAASIRASAAQLDSASSDASERLTGLLDALPGAHSQTQAIALALTDAGANAAEQVAMLDQRLDAVGERSQSAHSFAESAVQALADRLTLIANAGDRANDTVAGVEQAVERVTTGLIDADARLGTLHEIGVDRAGRLAASISALGGSADAMTEALRIGDDTAQVMIDRAEKALTAVDAVAREIDETLPDALARLDARIGESRSVVGAAKPELLALVTAAQSTHEAIAAIAEVIHEQRGTLDQLSGNLADTLSNSREKADALGAMMQETIGRAQSFARDAAPQLVGALLRVGGNANTPIARAKRWR